MPLKNLNRAAVMIAVPVLKTTESGVQTNVVSFPDVIEHDLYISEEGTELSGRSLKLEAKSGKVSM